MSAYVLLGFGAWWGRRLDVVPLHRPLPVPVLLFSLRNNPEAASLFGCLIGQFDCGLPASGRLDIIFIQRLDLIDVAVA
jgi:hypothetical protein